MLEPITKTRLSEEAVKRIRSYIQDQNLQPGGKLPAERELSQYLQISRNSVREALRILEIIGVIEVRPGSGAYIRDWSGDLTASLSSWLPQSRATLREHFEIRQLLEPRAAALSAERASTESLASLQAAVDQFREAYDQGDFAGMILADMEFHRRIAESTNNKTLTILMQTITRYLYDGWKGILRLPGRSRDSIVEHQKILAAIQSRDPHAAAAAMSAHLARATQDLESVEL